MLGRLLLPGLLLGSLLIWRGGWAQPTPPVMPKIEAVQLPAAIELPPPATPSAAAPTAPITAAEAVAIALHNQPSLAAASAIVTAAEGRTQVTRASLKSRAVLAAGINRSHEGDAGGAPADYQVSAVMRRLLYDYKHTRDLVNQSLAQEELARASLTVAQANLVLRVKETFYGLIQSGRLVVVAESNARNQRQHLAMAAARLDSGLGLPYDVVRAQTAYAEAIDTVIVAGNRETLARVELAKLLGLDPRTPLVPADGAETVAPAQEVEQLVEEALRHRPEMVQRQAALLAARHAAAAARTVNSPVVTGTLGVSTRGDGGLLSNRLLTIGVGVEWNALDGGETKGRVRETEATVEAADAQLGAVRLDVIAEVSQAHLDLQVAQQRVVTAKAGVTNATEALRLAEGRYRAGLGVFIDVLDAQAALDAANTRQVNAQYAVEQARAALEHAAGRNLSAVRTDGS